MVNNRLSEVLKQKKITRKDFAAMANTTPQYITGICTGKLTVSLKQLTRFAGMLNVPLTHLFVAQEDANIFYCPHCGKPIRVTKQEDNEGMDE